MTQGTVTSGLLIAPANTETMIKSGRRVVSGPFVCGDISAPNYSRTGPDPQQLLLLAILT